MRQSYILRLGSSSRQSPIIEYASSFYIEHSVKLAVKKLITAPSVSNIDALTDNIITEVGRTGLNDYTRFQHIISDLVDPALLTREMNLNPEAFTKDTVFDGGLKLKSILPEGKSPIEFHPSCFGALGGAIRDIRNGLSHGREAGSKATIHPTVRNFDRLQPWVSVISIVAGEVMLYRDLT